MKSCNGCRYLQANITCNNGAYIKVKINPYTGRQDSSYVGADGNWPIPDVTDMRAPGGRCGPEARLYEPNLRRRLWALLTGKNPKELQPYDL